jgi:hypothetical protein
MRGDDATIVTAPSIDSGKPAPQPKPSTPDDAQATAAPSEDSDSGDAVELGAIKLDVPNDWQEKPPGSSLVLAEFILPRAEGDDADGRLTVSTAGGTVEANIDRWKSQFQPQPTAYSQEVVDVAGLKVTIVDLSGDFNDQRGPFAPGEIRPGYRMIGAVIPVNNQLHFIKATGPPKTMAAHVDALHQFIRSARPHD